MKVTQFHLVILPTFIFLIQISQIICKINLPSPKKEYDQYLEECYKELNIDMQKIKAEDKMKRRCLSKCMAVKMGYMKEDGEIIMDVFNKIFNPNNDKENEEILKKCAEDKGKDVCYKSIEIESCIFSNSDFNNTPRQKIMKCSVDCLNEMNIQHPPEPGEESKENYNCFAKCIAEKCGWIGENNVLNAELIMKDLQLKKRDDVKKCVEITGDDLCERINKVDKCLEDLVYEE